MALVANSVFISVVISFAAMTVSSMGVIAKVLGDRISELGATLGGRVTGLEGRIDTRMNALEGAVRDVGERLTALEVGLGKR